MTGARQFSVSVAIGGKISPSLGGSIATAKTMLGGLASSIARINIRTASAISGAGAAVGRAGKSMQDAGKSLTASVSAPLGLLGMSAGKMAYEFELAGNKLEALGDATAAQRKEFEAFANVLNAKYPQSLAGIINTGNEMLKGGFNFDQMKGALDQTLATAVLGDMSPAEVGNMMARTINSFQLPMRTFAESQRSASRVSDQMTYAAVKTTASLKDMGEMYRYVGGASSAAGISLEQASGFAMAFAKNGSVGSDAGVAMRSAIVRMVKMPAKGLAAMQRIGLNLKDYTGGSRALTAGSIVGGLQADGIDATPVQGQIAKLLQNKALSGNTVKLSAAITKVVQGSMAAAGSAMDASKIAEGVQDSITAAGSKIDLVRFFGDLKKKMESGQAGLGDLGSILEGRHISRYMAVIQSDLPKLIADLTRESDGYTQARMGLVNRGIVEAVNSISASMEKLSVSLGRAIFPDLAKGINAVSDAVDKLSESSPAVMRFAGATGLAAIALGPFLMAGGATVRVVGFLAMGLLQLGRAATIGLASQLVAVASGVRAVTVAATIGAATRLRAIGAGMIALGAVGGSGGLLSAIGGSILAFGRSILLFPVFALRAIGGAMFALVANPVGITITAIVTALTALGVFVANNWTGIGQFFTAFGEGFKKALGPSAAGAVTGFIEGVKSAWEWVNKLLGPIDETGAKWKGWGEAAGAAAGAVVSGIASLPGKIAELGGAIATATTGLAGRAANAFLTYDWAGLGRTMVDRIIAGISGMGDALARKLSGIAGDAWSGVKSKLGFGGDAPAPAGSLPGRATGGSIHGGHPYMVGERGPEMIVPGASGTVIPHHALGPKAGGVNPALLKMIDRASAIAGVPLSIESGFRSIAHNRAVGGAGHSMHTQGLATDLRSPGHVKNEPAFWARINGAMRQAAAEQGQSYRWGGTFGGKYAGDWNHFDLGHGGGGGGGAAVARALGGRARGYARAQFGKAPGQGGGAPAPSLAPPAAMAALAAAQGGGGSTRRTRYQGGNISVEVNVSGAGGSPDEIGRTVAYEVRRILAHYESEQRGMLSD